MTVIADEENVSESTPEHLPAFVVLACVSVVFIAASLLSVPIPGINEPHYLCKARAFADSDWCSGDFFLQSANAHYVFFWVTGPLTELFSLPVVAAIGRVLSLMILAVGWTMCGRRLSLSAAAIVVSAAAFCGIALTGNLSGEWVIGGYEGKVPAYGFALSGVAFWFDARRYQLFRKYVLAGTFCGLSVALHPVVGLWFCIGIALCEIAFQVISAFRPPTDRPGRSWLRFFLDGLSFTAASIVLALPGLVPAAQMVLSTDLPVKDLNRANYIQMYWRLAHHLDPSTFPVRAWAHTAVLIATIVLLLRIAKRVNRSMCSQASGEVDTPQRCWRSILMLLGSGGLIVFAGVVVGWHSEPILKTEGWEWRANVLKFYPFRFFDALLPMTVAFSLGLVFTRLTEGLRVTARMVPAVVCVAIVLAAASEVRPSAPPGYSPDSFDEWKDACRWIRTNTPTNALVYGPREGFGFNWYAERAQYVCFKDCPQDAPGILEWNRRLWNIHGWSEKAYKDQKYDAADTRKLFDQFGVTHILTRKLGPFDAEPVYQNHVWRIYETVPAD